MLTIIQQLSSTKQKHTKYTQINTNNTQCNAPSVTKPNPENCKNCSSKCAYDRAQLQCTIQQRTVLIIFPLTSKQTS